MHPEKEKKKDKKKELIFFLVPSRAGGRYSGLVVQQEIAKVGKAQEGAKRGCKCIRLPERRRAGSPWIDTLVSAPSVVRWFQVPVVEFLRLPTNVAGR